MLRQSNAAGKHEVHGFPPGGVDELVVDFPYHVLKVARLGGVDFQPVTVCPEMEGIDPGFHQP